MDIPENVENSDVLATEITWSLNPKEFVSKTGMVSGSTSAKVTKLLSAVIPWL